MNIRKVSQSNLFSNAIVVIILINAVLIGFQATIDNLVIDYIQRFILGIFIIEIFIRWFGKNTVREYTTNFWNWFDIILVLISLIPPDIFTDASAVSALRVLRVFRVLRLFKAFPELQLMIKVLLKSFKSVSYAGLLLLIFMYIYSIIGVILFKGDTTVVTAHIDAIDPFGNILESFFSLFRVSTGEDWTDLRYDLLNNNVKTSPLIVNIYFLSWYILSAFLLMNIVFGSIINNYEVVYSKDKKDSSKLTEKIEELENKIDILIKDNKRGGRI